MTLIINTHTHTMHVQPGLTEQCNTDDITKKHKRIVFYYNGDSLILNHWLGRGYRKCKRCTWPC